MKDLNGKIISSLVGGIITLTAILFGVVRGTPTQEDISNRPTKQQVQLMINAKIDGVEGESEYLRDQRLLLHHMNTTNQNLQTIDEKISDLQTSMSAIEVEVTNIKENLPKQH